MSHNLKNIETDNKVEQKIVQSILRAIDQFKHHKLPLERLMESLDEAYSLESVDIQWAEQFDEYWDAIDAIVDQIELSCDIQKTRATPTATPQEQAKIEAELDKVVQLLKLV